MELEAAKAEWNAGNHYISGYLTATTLFSLVLAVDVVMEEAGYDLISPRSGNETGDSEIVEKDQDLFFPGLEFNL